MKHITTTGCTGLDRPLATRPLASKPMAVCLAVLTLLALLSSAGCVELPLPTPSDAPVETPREQTTDDLSTEALGAWKAGDATLAELLYSRLLERTDLDRQARLNALDKLAASAYDARHYYQAKYAMDRRASEDKAVLGTWPWHDLYIKILAALDRPELVENHQAWLAAHTELPFEVRARAAMSFAELYSSAGDAVRAVNILADAHRGTPGREAKLLMEKLYAERLRDLPEDQLMGLARAVGTQTARVFPHLLIQREVHRRSQQLLSDGRPSLAPAKSPARASLPGPLLAQNASRTAFDQPAALVAAAPAPGTPAHLAMVLPLSGRFAPTGQKVLRGAGAARTLLASQGQPVDLKIINSESPDWRTQLAALPADYAVVGGPLLNAEALRAMQEGGVLARRAVFAFQPDLGAVQEGKQAWRFYPGLKDQARVLLDLTANKLGIRSVAVLAPKNRYGQRMAEVFLAEAKARGLRVAGSVTYPPDDHPRWLHSVGSLLKIPDGFRHNKSMPLPMPDFGAVFMPEDWAQAEMLASNFYFFEGQHLLFLGTDLWSVGLDNAKDIDDTYFKHAACPGAWWPETNGGRALQAVLDAQNQGQGDFWVALGYDFVRMASRLGLGPDWTAAEVDARLAGLANLDYSLAPMAWDQQGVARQDLYLFTPRKEGKALVDPETMRQDIEKTRERRERRLVMSKEMQKSKKAGQSGSLTKDVTE